MCDGVGFPAQVRPKPSKPLFFYLVPLIRVQGQNSPTNLQTSPPLEIRALSQPRVWTERDSLGFAPCPCQALSNTPTPSRCHLDVNRATPAWHLYDTWVCVCVPPGQSLLPDLEATVKDGNVAAVKAAVKSVLKQCPVRGGRVVRRSHPNSLLEP
eukprot:3536776-Pyramimonas_sp.AAC.1